MPPSPRVEKVISPTPNGAFCAPTSRWCRRGCPASRRPGRVLLGARSRPRLH